MTRRLIFTVDVDRDVNIRLEGQEAAGSTDRGSGTAPRFVSSDRGIGIIADLLDDIGIKGTFFVEGRTAEIADCSRLSGHCIGFHGYDHEDLTAVTDLESVMDRGYAAVADNVSSPVCFRAPYMTMDDRIYSELSRLGIRHDSSVYADPGTPVYEVMGIMEHPVAKGRDGSGRNMAAYLWPMHEGRRGPADYVEFARGMDDGDLLISTHSWHMVETIGNGPMSEEEIGRNVSAVREALTGIIDEGFAPAIITD